jgi:hypothetical protein
MRISVVSPEPAEPGTASQLAVQVSADAEEFMAREHLAGEFLRARTIAEAVFPGASGMNLALQVDPGNESAAPTLVLGVVTSTPSSDFRAARKRFFRMLRRSGCEKLCLSLAVVRE